MLNVVCVNVGTKYDIEYVYKLRNMVKKHLKQEHRFACMTDKKIKGVWCFPPPDKHLEGWWAKISLFRDDLPFNGPVLFLDLDVIICGSLDDALSEIPEDKNFAIIRQWKKKIKPITKYGVTKKAYNASMMFFRYPGCMKEVYKCLTPEHMKYWRGDQDWIAVCAPDEFVWPDKFITSYELVGTTGPARHKDLKLILFSKLENHFIAPRVPWVRDMWR